MPIPVLVLVSFLGLLAYLTAGAAVAARHQRFFKWRCLDEGYWRWGAGSGVWGGSNEEYWFKIGVLALAWPALAIGWLAIGLSLGPAKLIKHVATYVAQIGD